MPRINGVSYLPSGSFHKNYLGLFVDRLKREGRWPAYRKRCQELWAEKGYELHGDIFWTAAKEFGFKSKDHEMRLYVDFLKRGSRSKHMQDTQDQMALARVEQKEQELRESSPGLNTHDLPADLAWIYTHPAMGRRESERTGLVPITEEDLKGAPNVGTANMLRFYVNHRDKFYDKILSNFSKKQASGDGEGLEDGSTKDIKEIDAMLADL